MQRRVEGGRSQAEAASHQFVKNAVWPSFSLYPYKYRPRSPAKSYLNPASSTRRPHIFVGKPPLGRVLWSGLSQFVCQVGISDLSFLPHSSKRLLIADMHSGLRRPFIFCGLSNPPKRGFSCHHPLSPVCHLLAAFTTANALCRKAWL